MDKKRCTQCKKLKPLVQYYAVTKDSDRRRPNCKECCLQAQRQHYLKNKSVRLDYSKQWRLRNKDKIKKIRQRFLRCHPGYYKEYRVWYRERRNELRRKRLTRKG